jgi:hypothetical protein
LLPATVKLAPFGVKILNFGISCSRFDSSVLVITATKRRRFHLYAIVRTPVNSRSPSAIDAPSLRTTTEFL